LTAYRGQYTPHLTASSRLGAIEGIASLLEEEENYFMRTRVLLTFVALESIANYLAGFPGRKNLVWVSGGFPLVFGFHTDDRWESLGGDRRYSARIGTHEPLQSVPNRNLNTQKVLTFEKECDDTVRALNAADVAVYPVDARGLTTNPNAKNNIATMKEIATGTGGKAYVNRNDLMNSITEAVQDSIVSYTLAYYPKEQNLDGRFRKVRVKVNRPRVSVRHRLGYFDTNNLPFDETAKEAAIREAVWSPLDATAVALEVQLNHKDAADPNALALRLKIDTGNLRLEQRGGPLGGTTRSRSCTNGREGC
jgi:VWFA-related protein